MSQALEQILGVPLTRYYSQECLDDAVKQARAEALKEAVGRAIAYFGWTGLKGYKEDADSLRKVILADTSNETT